MTSSDHSNNSSRIIRSAGLSVERAPAGGGGPGGADALEAHRKGKLEGRAEALRELSGAVNLLRAAAQAFEQERSELYSHADEISVTLALAIAKKILAREFQDAGTIRSLILRALGQAPSKIASRARLNPNDLRVLEVLRTEIQEAGERLPEELVLCPDASVPRGGCIIESPAGQVDARIETQLALIEEALRGGGKPGSVEVKK